MDKKAKTYQCSIKATDSGKRRFTATITTNRMDRDQEVMIPQGMDASEFLKTGTVFWNHDYNRPIAKALSMRKFDDHWESEAEMCPRPADFQGEFFPDFAWAMVVGEVVKGVSVGFDPLPNGIRRATPEDQKRWGADVRAVISKWKLLEWSLAPLQANVDALVTAVHKGLVKPEMAKAAFPDVRLDMPRRRKLLVLDFGAVRQPGESAESRAVRAVKNELARRRGKLYE